MTGMDTQLACVKFQALIYKMERYRNIFHMYNLFFPPVYIVCITKGRKVRVKLAWSDNSGKVKTATNRIKPWLYTGLYLHAVYLKYLDILTLKTPWNLHLKMSSVYVVCWIFLQTFQTYFCLQANSVDLDQTALEEQSDLGPHCLQKWLLKSQADDKADDNCCDWQFKVNF